MSSCNEYAEFLAHLCLETGARPHQVAPLARRLRRLATSHQRRCEVACNGCRACNGSGEQEREVPINHWKVKREKRACPRCSTDTLEDAIRAVCGELDQLRRDCIVAKCADCAHCGLTASKLPPFDVRFSGDPRGFTVRLLLPSGTYNTLGGASEGYGVPTSRG